MSFKDTKNSRKKCRQLKSRKKKNGYSFPTLTPESRLAFDLLTLSDDNPELILVFVIYRDKHGPQI